jgi:hypothetical protein
MTRRFVLFLSILCTVAVPVQAQIRWNAGQLQVGSVGVKKFPVWKRVKLGEDALIVRSKLQGFLISPWADDMIWADDFGYNNPEREIDLVKIRVDDLGMSYGGKLKEIFKKAKDLGLQLCPAATGPQVALAYSDQPQGGVRIAMEPLVNDGHPPGMFFVGISQG